MLGIGTLHATDKCHAHAAGQKWIFSIGFLSPSPARVTKNVYVWRPESNTVEDTVVALAHRLIMLGACLARNYFTHLLHDRRIPSRGHSNCLWKHCGVSRVRHSMQCLAPCLVVRDAETRYCDRIVLKLSC